MIALARGVSKDPAGSLPVEPVMKSVIGILVGVAVDVGRLQVDQTQQKLLPRHALSMTPQQASMTLRQLLTVTAGIIDGALNLTADDPVAAPVQALIAE